MKMEIKKGAIAHVCVVGAGLVGCLLSKLLADLGYKVTLFERRESVANLPAVGSRSTHLMISERGWSALRRAGLAEKMTPILIPLNGRTIHTPSNGVQFQWYSAKREPVSAIHRNEIIRVLSYACEAHENISFQTGCEILDVDASNGSITYSQSQRPPTEFGSEFIFAADGSNSTIRSLLEQRHSQNTQVYPVDYCYKEFSIQAGSISNPDNESMHAWPRGKTSLFAFSNGDGSFSATLLGPTSGDNALRKTNDPLYVDTLFSELFQDVSVKSFREDLTQTPISNLKSHATTPWLTGERLALIGDAAHAMLPFLGQGMNCGFEDCLYVVENIKNGNNIHEALKNYEEKRRPNSDAVTQMSAQMFSELTEQIGQADFHARKKVEAELVSIAPDIFSDPYEMMSFKTDSYVDVQMAKSLIETEAHAVCSAIDIEALSTTELRDKLRLKYSYILNKTPLAPTLYG